LENPNEFENELVFESYGVRIRIQATAADLLREAELTARKALVNRLEIIDTRDAEHTFGFSADTKGTLFMFRDGKQWSYDDSRKRFFKFFNSMLRIVVAEHALDRVFVHAGVVGWKGKAIVVPANSYQGKTTLVAELVKNGAEYYSDEYAILDEKGLVHPFPRDLSVRTHDFREMDVPVEELGGKTGLDPIPIGLVLLTEYDEKGVWNPERLTTGRGIMEMIPHTIPRDFNAQFALKVLNAAVSDAIILKSPRGDAANLALRLLSIF